MTAYDRVVPQILDLLMDTPREKWPDLFLVVPEDSIDIYRAHTDVFIARWKRQQGWVPCVEVVGSKEVRSLLFVPTQDLILLGQKVIIKERLARFKQILKEGKL